VVMGHTKCGAVTAACNHVELGNITALLSKIKPVVEAVDTDSSEMHDDKIEEVAELNVELSITRILQESPILAEMADKGEIEIVGAMYDVSTGLVKFM